MHHVGLFLKGGSNWFAFQPVITGWLAAAGGEPQNGKGGEDLGERLVSVTNFLIL